MSMYNMIHGRNPLAPLILKALGDPEVPRFRDCYLDGDKIAIYTRTGGGNRDFYDSLERCQENYPEYFEDDDSPSGPWNSDLRALPGFVSDEDDDFDSTYATFYFEIPRDFKYMFHTLSEIGAGKTEKPADAWRRVINDLDAGKRTQETQRAIESMRPMLEQIAEALKE